MNRLRQGGESTEMAGDPRGMERAVCWGWVSKMKREKGGGERCGERGGDDGSADEVLGK